MDFHILENSINNFNKNNIKIIDKNDENIFLYKKLLQNNLIKITQNGEIKKNVKYKNDQLFIGKLRTNDNFGFVTTSNNDYYIKNISNYIHDDQVIIISDTSDKKKEQKY